MRLIESPLLEHPKPWWQPYISLAITLIGIVFFDWHVQPIIYLFWWESILMISAALIRVLFALEGKSFWATILPKVPMLMGGLLIGTMLVVFSIVFTFDGFAANLETASLTNMRTQTNLMLVSYLVGLGLHYFGNGHYKRANPFGEFMIPFAHLLMIVALLMVFTQHLLPRFPQLNQAIWVTVVLVFTKFVVDLLFSKWSGRVRDMIEQPQEKQISH